LVMEMLHDDLVKFFGKRFSHLKHERMVSDATIQYSPSSHTEQNYTMSSMGDRVKEFMRKGVSDSEKNQYGLTTSHLHQHIKNLKL
jgi:hypothetical protein